MRDIPEQAIQAAADAAHEELMLMAKQMNVPMEYTQSISVNNYRVMRAALTAAATHLAVVRVKDEPWGWVIPRGGSKKPVILEASKFDQASAAAEADIHDLGYFPVYTHPALASSEDIDPARTEGFRQGIDAAAKLADYFEDTIYSEGMSEDVYYGISCTVSQIAREIRALHPVADNPDEAGAQGEGWQPIESAPKDGTAVLAYQAGRYFKCWLECDQYEGGYFWQDEEDSEPSPTHWRPLPTPPSGEVA